MYLRISSWRVRKKKDSYSNVEKPSFFIYLILFAEDKYFDKFDKMKVFSPPLYLYE